MEIEIKVLGKSAIGSENSIFPTLQRSGLKPFLQFNKKKLFFILTNIRAVFFKHVHLRIKGFVS